ncbi:MAG: hypothetical protein KDN19_19285 [Verrucomicrobiae bacterium]|nr:hypothetical protein [Verrucomicrobiae bacterium]
MRSPSTRFLQRIAANLRLTGLGIAILALTIQARGEDAKPSPEPEEKKPVASGILFVSKASLPKVYAPIDGAKETVLAPAYVGKYTLRLYSREKWEADGLAWESFYARALKTADELVDDLEVELKRDPRGVLDYAEVRSDSPWLSSVLLSGRFLTRFEEDFGERLHVIIVDRRQLYVFPADGGKLQQYAAALADLYHDDSVIRHPVSLEVFLVDKEGFRVIGSIGD